MSDLKAARLGKLTKEFNLGLQTMVDYLKKKGIVVEANPNTKVSPEVLELLQKEFGSDKSQKKDLGQLLVRPAKGTQVSVSINDIHPRDENADVDEDQDEVLIKDLNIKTPAHEPAEVPRKKIDEPKVLGKVDLGALERKRRKGKQACQKEEGGSSGKTCC
jgi:translation initiation factor IF-2